MSLLVETTRTIGDHIYVARSSGNMGPFPGNCGLEYYVGHRTSVIRKKNTTDPWATGGPVYLSDTNLDQDLPAILEIVEESLTGIADRILESYRHRGVVMSDRIRPESTPTKGTFHLRITDFVDFLYARQSKYGIVGALPLFPTNANYRTTKTAKGLLKSHAPSNDYPLGAYLWMPSSSGDAPAWQSLADTKKMFKEAPTLTVLEAVYRRLDRPFNSLHQELYDK
jgi:hypothetical protein